MVVGGGIGGMQSALDLANAGYRVYLVEGTTAIGGHMAQLDKTFPTNDCSMCTISPKLIEVAKHLNIEIITNAEVEALQGEAGHFQVTVLKRPRYVIEEKCNACGDCIQACPVSLPSEFDEALMERKAIFKRYPQAIPNAVAITKGDRAPCGLTCPTGINVQGYVALIAAGKFQEALALIRERNPFPSVCGRVCHHPCEEKCNRGELDQPIAINPLKRFVADYVREKRARGELVVERPPLSIDRDKPKIAVIGSGPAGLTAAQDLAQLGYPVTVFEALPVLGGMMRVGIPDYRLPKDMLADDIEQIIALGVEFKTNTAIGKDLTLQDLRQQGYKAVFAAVGTPLSRKLPLPGAQLPQVLLGVDFLRAVNLGYRVPIGKKVVVIGGGNVAIDVALTALRSGAEAIDLVCLESREEMPAHEWEIEDALEEGVAIHCSWGPVAILENNGNVAGLRVKKCTAVFDAQGKFNPAFDETVTTTFPADTVIIAIGQATDLSLFGDDAALLATPGGLIAVDQVTLQTPLEGVFAGGDAVSGPASVVEAIHYGHEAAISIDRYLRGADVREGRPAAKPEPAAMPQYRAFPRAPRQEPRKLSPTERRGNFKEITTTLTEEQAVAEAARCLNCGLCCECFQCVAVCGPKAVDHSMKEERVALTVGAVILAPGYESFQAQLKGEYGYGRMPNVITSLEFERILSASGPFQGHICRPSDHREPKKIAWIQCVGSRDVTCHKDYCSSVCCMYATKEAIMAVDHVPGLEATIFYNDLRAFGKGFETYYETAKTKYGVRYIQGIPSSIKEIQKTKNLTIKYVNNDGGVTAEEYDLVVLSTGLSATEATLRLADRCGITLNRFGFCETADFTPNRTSRPGIFVAGAFEAPMDIPETVMGSSSAAALAAELLASKRGTLVRHKEYPPERDVAGEEPRVGVFICRCGTNIGRVVGVSDVVDYAKTLRNVVYAEENLYTCSTDTQQRIIDAIDQHRLNRVVVASCTPRTHEPLFQETLCEAGINKYLFEMANIRDQCSWVHATYPEKATDKAKDLVHMAVARARELEPLPEKSFEVVQSALVIGGGVSGMTAARSLSRQGFEVFLVEREKELGGTARKLYYTLGQADVQQEVARLIKEVEGDTRIQIFRNAEVIGFAGHVGSFTTTIACNGTTKELKHGAVIVATGGAEYQPTEYLYGQQRQVLTQLELEEKIAGGTLDARALRQVVMVQCVGSREPEHQYCCRIGCIEAVKNALQLKRLNPDIAITILYRDIRTYAFSELYYRQAREQGVLFVRYDLDNKPQVTQQDGRLQVSVFDEVLGRDMTLHPDYLVLTAAVRPHPLSDELATRLKVPLNSDGFFLEAHMKLRPLDFANDGMYVCGLSHNPKLLSESISQAQGAAARAATILSQREMLISGIISVVDQERCVACLTCVRECPYDVPVISEEGVAYIEPAACQGCGMCASVCPRRAIELQHYKDGQLIAKCLAVKDEAA